MDILLSFFIGLGLSASCGFRVFVPLLIISVAAFSGQMTLAPGFAWIGSSPAVIAFGIATLLEVGGYYFPCVDNILDTVATPAAVVAGSIAMASMVSGMDPFLQWALAIIAGGGVAGLIQGATVVTRAASSLTTGGVLNPLVATAELGGAVLGSVLSMAAPIFMAVLVTVAILLISVWFSRRKATLVASRA